MEFLAGDRIETYFKLFNHIDWIRINISFVTFCLFVCFPFHIFGTWLARCHTWCVRWTQWKCKERIIQNDFYRYAVYFIQITTFDWVCDSVGFVKSLHIRKLIIGLHEDTFTFTSNWFRSVWYFAKTNRKANHQPKRAILMRNSILFSIRKYCYFNHQFDMNT